MHKSWILWIQILHLNQFMYQTNIAYETTKFSQQSVGSVPSLANLMDGRMSVLVLNAGPNISVCCVVFVPGPCAYQLHSHYNYLHSSLLLLLVLFPYQLPSPVCCPTLSAQLSTCVSLRGTHTFSLAPVQVHVWGPHCTERTGAVMVTCPYASPREAHTVRKGQVLWWSRDCPCGCADSCDAVRRRSPKAMWACNHLYSVKWGVTVDLQLSHSVGLAVRFGIASLLLDR